MRHPFRVSGRFRADEKGATLIEFAFLLPVLVLMVFGIVEFSLFMFASGIIENATATASRLGQTGDNYSGSTTADDNSDPNKCRSQYIRDKIRELSLGVIDPTAVQIETSIFTNFEDSNPPNGSESETSGFGTKGVAVLYVVSYPWELNTPLIATLFGKEIVTITSSVVVQNENFSNTPC